MIGNNKEKSRKRWAAYRQLGRTKFIIFFALYFSLSLTLINFFLELAKFGVTSMYTAVVRFLIYLAISPIMAYIIWKTSENRYSK